MQRCCWKMMLLPNIIVHVENVVVRVLLYILLHFCKHVQYTSIYIPHCACFLAPGEVTEVVAVTTAITAILIPVTMTTGRLPLDRGDMVLVLLPGTVHCMYEWLLVRCVYLMLCERFYTTHTDKLYTLMI